MQACILTFALLQLLVPRDTSPFFLPIVKPVWYRLRTSWAVIGHVIDRLTVQSLTVHVFVW